MPLATISLLGDSLAAKLLILLLQTPPGALFTSLLPLVGPAGTTSLVSWPREDTAEVTLAAALQKEPCKALLPSLVLGSSEGYFVEEVMQDTVKDGMVPDEGGGCVENDKGRRLFCERTINKM